MLPQTYDCGLTQLGRRIYYMQPWWNISTRTDSRLPSSAIFCVASDWHPRPRTAHGCLSRSTLQTQGHNHSRSQQPQWESCTGSARGQRWWRWELTALSREDNPQNAVSDTTVFDSFYHISDSLGLVVLYLSDSATCRVSTPLRVFFIFRQVTHFSG